VKNKNEKPKSTIIKDAMALFLITLVSALAISFVYETTKQPISIMQRDAKLEAYQQVYKEAASVTEDVELMKLASETDLESLDASFKNVTIDEISQALDSNNDFIGYVMTVTTKGYKNMTLAIGYSMDGTVQGMETLTMKESPGLGTKASNPEFKNLFADKKVDKFEVTKTKATADNQIDVISGATYTTKGVVNGINAGIVFLKEYAADFGGGANE